MSHKKHQAIGHGCTQGGYSIFAYAIPIPNIPFTGDEIIDRIIIGGIVGGITFLITKYSEDNM